MTSNTVIGAPAFDPLDLLQRVGQRGVGDQCAGDADALVEAHQMRRGVDVHAQPAASAMARRKAQVLPLPLVPADMDDRRQAPLGMAELRQQRAAADPG